MLYFDISHVRSEGDTRHIFSLGQLVDFCAFTFVGVPAPVFSRFISLSLEARDGPRPAVLAAAAAAAGDDGDEAAEARVADPVRRPLLLPDRRAHHPAARRRRLLLPSLDLFHPLLRRTFIRSSVKCAKYVPG